MAKMDTFQILTNNLQGLVERGRRKCTAYALGDP